MNDELHQQVVQQCARLIQKDHIEHEDIIRFLQKAKDPYSIPFIRQAIELKPRLRYLAYDDYGSYYKKCFWALRDIGTPEAIAIIREYTASDIEAASKEAVYRISKIDRSL
jgi:hypothetical protein